LNKKAFLAGDVTVMIYSIIALAGIAILFGGLFFIYGAGNILSPAKYDLQAVNPRVQTFETMKYYLDTKVSFDGKQLALNKAFPLYCFNKDYAFLEEIKSKTEALPIMFSKIDIFCVPQAVNCNEAELSLQEETNIMLAGVPKNKLIINLPEINPKTHVCLSIG
jgi:hypothetical protein